jgi:hypothetical protein
MAEVELDVGMAEEEEDGAEVVGGTVLVEELEEGVWEVAAVVVWEADAEVEADADADAEAVVVAVVVAVADAVVEAVADAVAEAVAVPIVNIITKGFYNPLTLTIDR